MRLADVATFEDLERYLKEFTHFKDEPAPYDFVAAFHLFLAILDNLARHHGDADLDALEEFQPWFTPAQREFLRKLDDMA